PLLFPYTTLFRSLRHRIDLGHTDDCAGGIVLLGPVVPDVDFIGIRSGDLLWISRPNEDAAVRVRPGPEFHAQLEVSVAVLRHQEPVALVGHDRAVLDTPIGIAD